MGKHYVVIVSYLLTGSNDPKMVAWKYVSPDSFCEWGTGDRLGGSAQSVLWGLSVTFDW